MDRKKRQEENHLEDLSTVIFSFGGHVTMRCFINLILNARSNTDYTD